MTSTPPADGSSRRTLLLAAAAALLLVVLGGVWLTGRTPSSPQTSIPPPPAGAPDVASGTPPTYVGSQACAGCHQDAFRLWQGSQHAVAMQVADDKTVLGDFNDIDFRNFGVTTRFFRRNGKYLIRTEGPDGKTGEFEVQHVFGVYPLQQYLVELPGGHVQAFSVAWDARPAGQGGQRWFHLYPNERIEPRDELHWTKRQQNWNQMCADCHSTDVRKGYDQASHGYRTTRSEDGVGCEACHGPGSAHVAWAGRPAALRWLWRNDGLVQRFDERRSAAWRARTRADPPVRTAPR